MITIDVYPNEGPQPAFEVRAIAKAGSTKLLIEGAFHCVTFHGLTDDQYQQIADAVELYLIRKNQRERKDRQKAETPAVAAPEAPDAKV